MTALSTRHRCGYHDRTWKESARENSDRKAGARKLYRRCDTLNWVLRGGRSDTFAHAFAALFMSAFDSVFEWVQTLHQACDSVLNAPGSGDQEQGQP